jgi:hypothetical protein
MRLHVESDNPNGVRIWHWTLYAEIETEIPSCYPEHKIEIPFMKGEADFYPAEAWEDTIVRIARGIKVT